MDNPWIITVVGGIAVGLITGLILYYVFGIGRHSQTSENNKKVGIITYGKHTKIKNCKFSGMNIGIEDHGKNTEATNNEFK